MIKELLLSSLLLVNAEISGDPETLVDGSPEIGQVEEGEHNNEMDILEDKKDGSAIEYNIIIDYPVAIYEVNEDDGFGQVMPLELSGDVYNGSYSSSVISIWEGIIYNNIGKKYVGYRANQYDYYLVISDSLSYSNGRFSGSGSCYHINTYNYITYDIGTQNINISVGDAFVYSNINENYPRLEGEGILIYEQNQSYILLCLVGLSIFKLVLFKR